jgi:hypothetical protein
VEEALIEMYLAGVSVRRVADITEALWGTRVSPGTVSNLKGVGWLGGGGTGSGTGTVMLKVWAAMEPVFAPRMTLKVVEGIVSSTLMTLEGMVTDVVAPGIAAVVAGTVTGTIRATSCEIAGCRLVSGVSFHAAAAREVYEDIVRLERMLRAGLEYRLHSAEASRGEWPAQVARQTCLPSIRRFHQRRRSAKIIAEQFRR